MGSLVSKVWLPFALALLCTFAAPRAFADETRARARALFDEGVTQYEAGHYREALSAFEQAYRVAPHPSVRVNIANCYEQLGQPVEALHNFRRFVDESGDRLAPDARAEIERTMERLAARIGRVRVAVEPTSAKLTVDGREPKYAASGELQLATGTYTLEASAPGYEPTQRTLVVHGGKEQRVSLSLSPRGTAPIAAVTAPPPADSSPAPAVGLDASQAARAADGASLRRPLMWAAAGTTAALATGFAVSGGLAIKAQNDFDRAVKTSNDASLDAAARERARRDGIAAADQADLRAMLSDVFLVGTIVGVGASVLIYLTTKEPTERRATSFNAGPMMLKRGGAGVAVGGKF